MEQGQPQQQVANFKTPLLKRKLFNSRLSRANLWLGLILLHLLLALLLELVIHVSPDPTKHLSTLNTVLRLLVVLPIPSIYAIGLISLFIRRVHDLGYENYSRFTDPIEFLFLDGKDEPNQFGNPQKGIGIRQIIGID